MIKHLIQSLLTLVLLAVLGSADAAPPAPAPATAIRASAAWIRLPPPAATVAAGYVQLHNPGSTDRLLSVSAEAFAQVQIHAMRMDGEVMRMQPLPEGLALPAAAVTELKPGGYHLMLIGPRQALQPGQRLRLQLHFAHAPAQSLDFVVAATAADAGVQR